MARRTRQNTRPRNGQMGLPNHGVPSRQNPRGGDQRRAGVTDRWLRNQLQNQDWTWGGTYQDRPGASDNMGIERGQLGHLMNNLAQQGLGRKGLRYLMDNQRAQSVLESGRGNGQILNGVDPTTIRWLMQNNYRGPVDTYGNQGTTDQSRFFTQFPQLWAAYVQQTGQRRNGNFNFGGQTSFEDVLRNAASSPMAQTPQWQAYLASQGVTTPPPQQPTPPPPATGAASVRPQSTIGLGAPPGPWSGIQRPPGLGSPPSPPSTIGPGFPPGPWTGIVRPPGLGNPPGQPPQASGFEPPVMGQWPGPNNVAPWQGPQGYGVRNRRQRRGRRRVYG